MSIAGSLGYTLPFFLPNLPVTVASHTFIPVPCSLGVHSVWYDPGPIHAALLPPPTKLNGKMGKAAWLAPWDGASRLTQLLHSQGFSCGQQCLVQCHRPSLVTSCGDLSTKALQSLSASLLADNILFVIDNNNDEQEMSALDGPPHRQGKADQAVHFCKHLQVIALPLWSNLVLTIGLILTTTWRIT